MRHHNTLFSNILKQVPRHELENDWRLVKRLRQGIVFDSRTSFIPWMPQRSTSVCFSLGAFSQDKRGDQAACRTRS